MPVMLVNAYSTHRDPPAAPFPHALRSRRTLQDPELRAHLNGFMGFVMGGGKRKMNASRYHVLGHIERVRHQLAMEVDPAQLGALGAWAQDANAILFLPDATVRAPDGKVLVAPDTGDAETGADVPHPQDAVRRKQATEAALAARGVRVPASLPPVVSEVEVELRTAGEVASRCLALFACAVRGESLASGEPISAAEIRAKVRRAFEAMSPRESAFFASDEPAKQDVVNAVWRYEALAALAWAIGAVVELPFPTGLCDVPRLARTMLQGGGRAVADAARLRETGAILDALDACYRLHWATTEARVKKAEPPAGVEPGVVAERHHALNWLVRFQDADWDDVDTPT
jgi:hypothetical protein